MSSPAFAFRSRMPRIAEAAVERARLTVVPLRRTQAAKVPFVLLVSLLLLTGVVGLLLFNTSLQQASFTATALQDRATMLAAQEQSLRMQLDALRDPQRIAQQARAMGMVTSCSPAFLDLADGKVLGKAVPASTLCNVQISPPPPPLPAVLYPRPTYVDAPPGESTPATGDAGGKKKNTTDATSGSSTSGDPGTASGTTAPTGR